MSRKPGIGTGWIEKYYDDVYPQGQTVINGKLVKAPKFYDKKYKLAHPLEHEDLELTRHLEAARTAHDNTDTRLKAKEQVQAARLAMLPRTIN